MWSLDLFVIVLLCCDQERIKACVQNAEKSGVKSRTMHSSDLYNYSCFIIVQFENTFIFRIFYSY